MSKTIPGALAICCAATLWGLDGVVLTPRLYNLSVPFVVLLLHLIPFGLMQPFFFRRYKELGWLNIHDWLALTLVALCGGIVGTFAIVKALFLVNFNQLSVVVVLQKLQPVFAIALAAILLGERLTRGFVVWAALAIAGAYCLTFGLGLPDLEAEQANTAAAVWAAVAAAAFGSATVFGKKLLQTLEFRLATFARFGVTTVLALCYLLISGLGLPFAEVTAANWLVIVLIGVTTGSGAIFLFYYGLSRVRAMVSAICELCLPLSAIVFDYFINGSILGPWQWIGGATLILAIFRVSVSPSAPAPQGSTG